MAKNESTKSPYYQPKEPEKSPYYPKTDDGGNLPKNNAEEDAYTEWLKDEGEDTSKR